MKLLRYAQELEHQTMLVRELMEGRGPATPIPHLIAGIESLRAKCSALTGALRGAP